ncbi:hypothetical protein XBKQ1_360004 [Xenorhabdus bovienii str. kraussei Quebec]|uniref:Uncharacterized protein n=1 Tax=Xenorhabdus bovienii str. kraussei Quebec TaxID=1398203 RepID=A0A077PL62_XENBV|nr:hypothetical protein XBKQ1_360004 [Xenorhabdus bovienii str. kraussei Quebec]
MYIVVHMPSPSPGMNAAVLLAIRSLQEWRISIHTQFAFKQVVSNLSNHLLRQLVTG